jgi:AcrR family transcriptional regulator
MPFPARAPGRPLDATIDEQLLRVTQDLLIEEGFERLTMDAVARRCGASKATIYRRWPGKTALVVAAAAALFHAPEVPDTGDLREDLLACGRAYVERETRNAEVLASVISASRHDAGLREASRQALGAPYIGLFENVLSRAVDRGLIRPDVDVETLAQVFPAFAYQKVAARGLFVSEDDVQRVVDGVLLPALGQHQEQ